MTKASIFICVPIGWPYRNFLFEGVKISMCGTRKSFHWKNVSLKDFNKIKDIKKCGLDNFSSKMIRGYVIRGRKKFKIWWQTIPQITKFSPQCLLSFVIGFCQNVFWTSNFSSHSSFNKTNAKMVENNIRVSFQDAKSSWYNHQSALQAMCNVFIKSFIYELLY